MGFQVRKRTKGKSGWWNGSYSKKGVGASGSVKLASNVTWNTGDLINNKTPSRLTINFGNGIRYVSYGKSKSTKNSSSGSSSSSSGSSDGGLVIAAIVIFLSISIVVSYPFWAIGAAVIGLVWYAATRPSPMAAPPVTAPPPKQSLTEEKRQEARDLYNTLSEEDRVALKQMLVGSEMTEQEFDDLIKEIT